MAARLHGGRATAVALALSLVVGCGGDKPPVFVASHRRLPHVGAKVAFLSNELLQHVAGATLDTPDAAELGFLAFGEFIHSGGDRRLRL